MFTEIPLADDFRSVTNYHGEVVYMTDALATKLEQEANTWHWKPWLPTRTVKFENYVVEVECLYGDSIDSFPDGIFTGEFFIYFSCLISEKVCLIVSPCFTSK